MTASKTDMTELRKSAGEASALLKVLANPERLLLLCQMTQSELAVSELAAATGVEQPTLSQQLTVLRLNGLVATRREGKQVFYRITSQNALQVMQVLYALYCQQAPNEEGMR